MKPLHATREQYLMAATDLLKPRFRQAGHDLPPVRVSVGWPSTRRVIRGLSNENRQ